MAATDVLKERPVMSASTVTALLTAIYTCLDAFNVWDFTDAQRVAVGGLIAAIGLMLGKAAASNVYVPSTVAKVVDSAVAEVKVEADAKVGEAEERAAIAESFGVPHQNQSPHPLFGPVGGRLPDVPPPPPIPRA